ncbi:hypothetical protein MUK42_12989 [Musa troglodytarum]|uniref:Uncharacterized protein n=1 Tax=Musa troglodytarum TaxID=320322 RepID=A0A9E7H698_9LILI|nr:hypothetical protein MUK42_12989 [Musa troglodytarum]
MEHREKGCMVPGSGADKASKVCVALDMGDDTGNVEGIGALCREDWHLLACLHRID